jgi:hypothetical protein
MTTYRITCMFDADWANLYPALFGTAQHCASMVNGNAATFTFATPQTPANLGPLVVVTVIPNP